MSELILRLDLDDDPEIVERDARALLRQISESVDHNASRVPAPPEADTRAGGGAMLGEIALAVISSGALAALFDVLKAYFSRRRGGKIIFTTAEGEVITLEADDIRDASFQTFADRVGQRVLKPGQ